MPITDKAHAGTKLADALGVRDQMDALDCIASSGRSCAMRSTSAITVAEVKFKTLMGMVDQVLRDNVCRPVAGITGNNQDI